MMTYKEYKNNSFNLYTIKTDKFKTCHMEIVFYNKLEKANITKEIVLADMIAHSNKKFPKRKFVVEHLEDLYNASFFGATSRVGNVRTINFVYNFIDPIYADKSYFKEVLKFPFEMIFNPNIKNDEFDNRTLKIIKNRVKASIESVKESPTRYAIKQAIKKTDQNIPAAYDYVGNIKDLNKINSSNLVEFYKYMLDNYYCDIYLIGNLNMDKVNIFLKELFLNNIIKTVKIDPVIKNKCTDVKEFKEKDNFEQSTLVCIYNTDNLSDIESFYTMQLFNYIFGNGSLSNKLYTNLREKNSLCYNVSSLYQKYDNLMIVQTGISAKNKKKAVALIKKSLKEMINGEFTDEELANSKKSIVNRIKSANNYPTVILNNYFAHNLTNYPLINDMIDKFDDISKKDIINLAKKMKLITIYLMEGEEK